MREGMPHGSGYILLKRAVHPLMGDHFALVDHMNATLPLIRIAHRLAEDQAGDARCGWKIRVS